MLPIRKKRSNENKLEALQHLKNFAHVLDLAQNDAGIKAVYANLPDDVKQDRSLKNLMMDDLRRVVALMYRDVDMARRPNEFYANLMRLRNPGATLTTGDAASMLDAEIEDIRDVFIKTGKIDSSFDLFGFIFELDEEWRQSFLTYWSETIFKIRMLALDEAALAVIDENSVLVKNFNATYDSMRIQKEAVQQSFNHLAKKSTIVPMVPAVANMNLPVPVTDAHKPVDIKARAKQQMEKDTEIYALRSQREQIEKRLAELGATDASKADKLRGLVKEAGMSAEALERANRELDRLAAMNPQSNDAAVIANYVQWLTDVPWSKASTLDTDIAKAERILDKDHYGLHKVKRAVAEYVAVQNRTGNPNGTILCLVGPPGVGKTSIAKSIARATGRDYVRMALGGVRDEAAIRGHSSTYLAAQPGRIIKAMKEAGTVNPLITLDELDKLGTDSQRGNPADALLEVLDPEQNHTFKDHYLDVDYDLSKVMFIATANYEHQIPEALRDRMEIIRLPGYTADEKLEIARQFLVPKQMIKKKLSADEFSIDDPALNKLIVEYTREAGVRGLEREIDKLARRVVADISRGTLKKVEMTADNLAEFAGPPRISAVNIPELDQVGVVNGLAYTTAGGVLLQIEATAVKAKSFQVTATGGLGEDMKESISLAQKLIEANAAKFGVEDIIKTTAIHLNAPSDSRKDGPSAGAAITLAILSALRGVKVRREYAMTGKIGLQGQILPIGGVSEKLQGALSAGAKVILIPKANEKDLADVPKSILDKLIIKPVATMEEVLQFALTEDIFAKNDPAPSASPKPAFDPGNGAERSLDDIAELKASVQKLQAVIDGLTASGVFANAVHNNGAKADASKDQSAGVKFMPPRIA